MNVRKLIMIEEVISDQKKASLPRSSHELAGMPSREIPLGSRKQGWEVSHELLN